MIGAYMAERLDYLPIIIIGAARSGTKFARSVIAASRDAKAVPYDVNYVWRYGQEWLDHDELPPQSMTPKIAAYIHHRLDRLANIAPGERTILVEKTVSNTLRVPFIEKVYPGARYVHLIRDGRAVIESSMRLWRAPPDVGALATKLRQMPLSNIGYVAWFAGNFVRGLVTGRRGGQVWGPRYKGIMQDVAAQRALVEICSLQWQRSVEKALADLAEIPAERVFVLRYGDLVGSEEHVRNLIRFAGLSDEASVLAFYRKHVRSDNDEKWRATMREEDIDRMLALIGPTLAKLGFVDGSQADKPARSAKA